MALKYLFSVFKFECAWCSNSSLSKYIHMCMCTSEYVYIRACFITPPPKSIMFNGDNWGPDLLHIL